MTVLQSSNVHATCRQRGIMNYLDGPRGERALAHDFLNLTPRQARQWDVSMDRTRALAGHDRKWGGRDPIAYYHFILSPDPRDGVDIDTLRRLALNWSRRLFGDEHEPGLLGCYQVAITYHDDNTNRIPHAHVVVNCTNMDNDRKMHLSKRDNEGLLPDLLGEVSRELGLSHFDEEERIEMDRRRRELSHAGAVLTSTELGAEKRLGYSWKQEMREKIDIAKMATRTEEEFVAQLLATGICVRPSREVRGEWVYGDVRNPYRLACRADRLGHRYSRAGVERHRSLVNARDPRPLTRGEAAERWRREAAEHDRAERAQRARMRENLNRQIAQATLVASFSTHVELDRVVAALAVNERHNIRCMADYDAAIAREERLAALDGNDARARQLEELRDARALAAQGNLFAGVEPVRPLRRPPAAKPAKSRAQKRREWQESYAPGTQHLRQRGQTEQRDGRTRPR